MGWLRKGRKSAAVPRPHEPLLQSIEQGLVSNDTALAWNATWDLISEAGPEAKADALVLLRRHINGALRVDERTAGDADTATEPQDRSWHRAAQAVALEEAVEQSTQSTNRRVLSSREVRKHHERQQIRRYQESLTNLGVREGEGLPAWLLYMSRRSRKSWD